MTTTTTLFLGLNDKDTKRQEIETSDALTLCTDIVLQHYDGATISAAKGIYTHDDGTIVTENSLRIELLYADNETTAELIEHLKFAFNQECIGVTRQVVECEFV